MREIAKSDNPTFASSCQYAALLSLTACAFVIPISVTLTTLTYLLAWILILVSGHWQTRWQFIKTHFAALSFWALFTLFILGLIYTFSPWNLALHDLQKRHWLLATPFFIMIIHNDHWRTHILNAFLTAMIITLVFSYLKLFGIDFYYLVTHQTLSGTNVFFEHIVQNFFMSIAAFIAGYRYLFQSKWRALYLILFLLMGMNILFLSEGRTGYIVFFILSTYLCALRFKWKGIIVAATTLCTALVFAYTTLPSIHNRIHDTRVDYYRYQHGETITPIGLRIGMLHNAILLIKEHPWIGYGTGGIRTAMQEILSSADKKRTELIDYVENSALNFILEFGLFGFLIFLTAIAIQIRACFYLPTEYKHLMLAFLMAFLTGGLFNSFFVSFCEAHLYSIIAAVCFSTFKRRVG